MQEGANCNCWPSHLSVSTLTFLRSVTRALGPQGLWSRLIRETWTTGSSATVFTGSCNPYNYMSSLMASSNRRLRDLGNSLNDTQLDLHIRLSEFESLVIKRELRYHIRQAGSPAPLPSLSPSHPHYQKAKHFSWGLLMVMITHTHSFKTVEVTVLFFSFDWNINYIPKSHSRWYAGLSVLTTIIEQPPPKSRARTHSSPKSPVTPCHQTLSPPQPLACISLCNST